MRYRDDKGWNWAAIITWFVLFPLYIWGLIETFKWLFKK